MVLPLVQIDCVWSGGDWREWGGLGLGVARPNGTGEERDEVGIKWPWCTLDSEGWAETEICSSKEVNSAASFFFHHILFEFESYRSNSLWK